MRAAAAAAAFPNKFDELLHCKQNVQGFMLFVTTGAQQERVWPTHITDFPCGRAICSQHHEGLVEKNGQDNAHVIKTKS